jgi:hypothetical protein
MLTKEKSTYLIRTIFKLNTKIESIIKDIRIGKNKILIIIKIQFSIQLTTTRTIHQSQGLLLDDLVFNPTNVRKHGLSYSALFHI